jgi:F-type H+-transporting ATPase subunit delta
MSSVAANYSEVLYQLDVSKESVAESEKIFKECPVLLKTLDSPVLPLEKKSKVIDRIFPDDIKNFLKVVCKNGRVSEIINIFSEYKICYNKKNKILTADVYYVAKPTDQQQEKIKVFLKKNHNANEVKLNLIQKPELLGGFIINANGYEYDRSFKSKLDALNRKFVRR